MFSADAPQRVAPPGATSFERPVPVEAQAEVVRSITVPFMVATGVDDTNTPAPLCRKLAAANPQARWVEIPGAGHMSPLEQPAAVTAALKRLW